MADMKNKAKQTKTKVFNVVILDKSGSMSSIRQAAIDGFNETLAGIKKAQEMYGETQEHFISLITFCSCGRTFVYDKVPVFKAKSLTRKDYEPCCCTPLYDAMGFTLTNMRKYVNTLDDTMVLVTVITDGMENASCEYSGPAVKRLVEDLEGEGWSFTYMGANQDSGRVAFDLSIKNFRDFDYSDEGTMDTMAMDKEVRMNFFSRLDDYKRSAVSEKDVKKRNFCYKQMADDAFMEEKSKED